MVVRSASYYRMRAEKLEKRDYETNKRLIAKLMRKVRQLEKAENIYI